MAGRVGGASVGQLGRLVIMVSGNCLVAEISHGREWFLVNLWGILVFLLILQLATPVLGPN